MHDSTREMLNQIDEFLSKLDEPAAELAAVLTALRGPDTKVPHEGKSNVTIPIRQAALPKTFAASEGLNWLKVGTGRNCRAMSFGNFDDKALGKVIINEDSHFCDHGMLAAEVLGLQIERQDVLAVGVDSPIL